MWRLIPNTQKMIDATLRVKKGTRRGREWFLKYWTCPSFLFYMKLCLLSRDIDRLQVFYLRSFKEVQNNKENWRRSHSR